MKRRFNWKSRKACVIFLCCAVIAIIGLSSCRTVEHADFDSAGTQIHYTVQDSGEPLILLHGWSANGWANWKIPRTAGLLNNEFQVVIPDHRRHGKSGKPVDPDAYGIEMANDVGRLMNELGIDSAYIADYSMGGFIALKFTVEFPDRVRALALGGAGWHPELGLSPLSEDATLNPFLHQNFRFEAFAAIWSAQHELEVTETELRTLNHPLLVVVGSEDRMRSNANDLIEVLPETQMVIVEGKGHAGTVFSRTLRKSLLDFFVAQQDSADSDR